MDSVYIVPTYNDFAQCNYANYIAYCNSTDGVGNGCISDPMTANTMYFLSGTFSHCFSNNQKVSPNAL